MAYRHIHVLEQGHQLVFDRLGGAKKCSRIHDERFFQRNRSKDMFSPATNEKRTDRCSLMKTRMSGAMHSKPRS
jgi:hypothetical protein